jgi:hypothetical protein
MSFYSELNISIRSVVSSKISYPGREKPLLEKHIFHCVKLKIPKWTWPNWMKWKEYIFHSDNSEVLLQDLKKHNENIVSWKITVVFLVEIHFHSLTSQEDIEGSLIINRTLLRYFHCETISSPSSSIVTEESRRIDWLYFILWSVKVVLFSVSARTLLILVTSLIQF